MDINKIYNALQSLPLPIEQINLLIEAFTSGEQNVQQVETSQQDNRAISNIKNVEVSTATIPTIVGVINTLLVNFRTAGIIQM